MTNGGNGDFGERFLVRPEKRFRLEDVDPSSRHGPYDKASAEEALAHYCERLKALQYLLYAEGKRGLLICLQALDAGGKDGTIRHVFGVLNPQGCRVQSFKTPTPEEAAHDFLWRVHRVTPARGEVVVFNRSHYEDVLVARVHGLAPESAWKARFDAINEFEHHLGEAGIHVLKFFLHISRDEQLQRFNKRIEDPGRHWKISEADYAEREYWGAYQEAYEEVLNRCSRPDAPWYVIPADHKWYRNIVVCRIVAEYLEALGMKTPEAKVDIEALKRKYHIRTDEKGK